MNQNKERTFNLVRQILRSPKFLVKTTDQQQRTLDEIIATGEISREDVYTLLQEQLNSQNSISRIVNDQSFNSNNQYTYLENLPYSVFLNILDQGRINGRDLVHLCNSSPKLREMCLKTRESVDNQGRVYKSETQYVYRKILEQMGIEIKPNESPSEIYAKASGGYQLWEHIDTNPDIPGVYGVVPYRVPSYQFVKIKGMSFAKEIAKAFNHTLVLDTLGYVWSYGLNNHGQLGLGQEINSRNRNYPLDHVEVVNYRLTSNNEENKVPVPVRVPNLSNIIQIVTSDDFSAALDSNGRVWTCGLVDPQGLPDPNPGERINRISFAKINLPPVPGKIIQISLGNRLLLINDRHELYSSGQFVNGKSGFQMTDHAVKSVNQKYMNSFHSNHVAAILMSGSINYKSGARSFRPDKPVKKVIPVDSTLIILYEDGTLDIKDLLDGVSGKMTHLNVGNEDVRFVDIDASNFVGYAVGNNGSLYKFRSLSPNGQMIGFGLPAFGELALIPGIENVVKVSMVSDENFAVLTRNFAE